MSESNILDQIVATKRQEVAERRERTPVEELKRRIEELGRPRNFFQAVTRKTDKPLNLIVTGQVRCNCACLAAELRYFLLNLLELSQRAGD